MTAVEKGLQRRSRIAQTLHGDPAASPLGGAHRLGAPYYSSHRAPQRVHLGPSLAAALLDSLFEQPEVENYSLDPRNAFRRPCFFLLSIRLFCELLVGFVALRFLRGMATLWMSTRSRSKASARFCSWLRYC